MAPPAWGPWGQLSVHAQPCVGTARRALSEVEETLAKEMDALRKEGQWAWTGPGGRRRF